ncbi:MAG: DUF4276 family protein [Deltaproteobacteria bacterium]|nr:DUF4276 family protein [Deltaproteobacteria bacterium]
MSTIVLIVEGDTERAAKDHLKRFLDSHSGERPKARLKPVALDGGLSERRVRGLAEGVLRDPSVSGVIALTDLYPKFASAEDALQTLRSWLPADTRCHAAVAKHDFEAWLLVGWEAIVRQARVGNRQPWGAHPEEIDGNNPPAHRLSALFQQGPHPRRYKKPIDGKKLFEQTDLAGAAEQCPELRRFLNCLLSCAGYPPLP